MGNQLPKGRKQGGDQKVLSKGDLHKGMYNGTGLYHCFLNVVIQSLWHLRSFRERFLALDYTHVCLRKPCAFCALRAIFTMYKFGAEKVIPPEGLRKALSEIYKTNLRFQLETMADATECLDEILKLMHCDHTGIVDVRKYDEIACTPQCISHAAFGALIMDQKQCVACGATSDPVVNNSFVFNVYAQQLLSNKSKSLQKMLGGVGISGFYTSVKKQWSTQKYSCPGDPDENKDEKQNRCRGKAKLRRWCLGLPEVFAVNITWPEEPSKSLIEGVMSKLQLQLKISKLLEFPKHLSKAASKHDLALSGMICYYGRHYFATFRDSMSKKWLLLNDKSISVLGSWKDVIRRCEAGKWQPTMAFYESKCSHVKSSIHLARSMIQRKSVTNRPPSSLPPPPPTRVSKFSPGHEVKIDIQSVGSNLAVETYQTSPSTLNTWVCKECGRKWDVKTPSLKCPMCDTLNTPTNNNPIPALPSPPSNPTTRKRKNEKSPEMSENQSRSSTYQGEGKDDKCRDHSGEGGEEEIGGGKVWVCRACGREHWNDLGFCVMCDRERTGKPSPLFL
ncbi:hypothetical protein AAMO2058_000815700 [Amorphochlora amoebiformis]